MAKLKQAITLKHTASAGSETEEIAFEKGEEVTVLKEWTDFYLAKNSDGKLFNIEKSLIEED